MEQAKEYDNSEAVSANASFDHMSNQEMCTELQRLGIQACESTPKEILQQLLKLVMKLNVKPLNTPSLPTAPTVNYCEAFFCPICTDEYSPTEMARTPRSLDCGHSFCMSCLIQARSQHVHNASSTYGIKCPTCRSFTCALTKDDVKALPKNFTAIAMLQSTKRNSIEASSAPSKRRCLDNAQNLTHAARMCELLEGRPDVLRDPAKAFQMAEEGSQAGCIHSMGILGRCYMTGAGVEMDAHRGLQLGRESAVAGSSYGEFVVGFAYETGSGGVEQDLQEAVEHYKVAMLLNIAQAQFCLAGIYIKYNYMSFDAQSSPDDVIKNFDRNLLQNETQAIKILRQASDQGHADAQISLAIELKKKMSASDYCLPDNEALSLLKLALKQGCASRHLEGLCTIAGLYQDLGDNVEAFKCHKLASDQGHYDSIIALAEMLIYGFGVDQNIADAIAIHERLIETCKGTEKTMAFVSIRNLYLAREDNSEALKWCKRGADEDLSFRLLHDCARMYEGWNPLYMYSKISLKGNGIESIEIDFAQAAKYYKLSVELFCDSDVYAFDAADSAYALAKMYDEGRGVDQNFEEAVRLLKIGVEQRNQDCKIHLACMFEEGRGVVKNLDTAARMFMKLFEDDDVDYDHDDDYDYDDDDDYKERVFCRLASMYNDGRGVPQNKQEALRILNHKRLSKNAEASYLHASILLQNASSSSKKSKTGSQVTSLLKIAASQNHPDAKYLLACQSKGVKKKIALLKEASKGNNINATFKLACMLADGEEVARDDKEAATLFMTAVSKGHVESHCRLADLFEQGKGVAQSSETAAMLYGLAAEKKSVCALWNLSRMYKHGLGVIQSDSEAFKFCKLAALQGFPEAKYDLGCMYAAGVGESVPLVRSEVVRWFSQAASQGHQAAAVASEAVRWFSQAASQGHQAAAAALKRLSNFDTVIAQPESHLNAPAPVVSA